jgi:hypothetical protein
MLHNIQQIGYNINIERGKGNKEVLKMDKWQIRTCEMAIRDCEARLVGAKEEGEQNPDLPQNVKQELQDGSRLRKIKKS